MHQVRIIVSKILHMLQLIKENVDSSAKEFRIGYGDVKARDVIRLTANSALIHSHFNQATLENDIAIIPLSNGQTFNENIAKIIPIARNSPPMSREGVVASFGFTSNTASTISERLMVARQVVIPNGDCREVFKRAVHRNQFCAQDQPPQPPAEEEAPAEEETPPEGGDTPPAEGGGASPGEGGGASPGEETPSEGGQGGFPSYDWGEFGRSLTRRAEPDVVLSAVCRGDTGSALVYKVDDKYIAYGLVSRVPNGCNRKQPALYTSLSAFIQWIEDATLGAADIVNA